MKALVKTAAAPGHVEYRDWPSPEIGPEDVLIAVRVAGVCGTDLSMYEWNRVVTEGYRPTLPLVIGHEFAGEIVEVGREVRSLRVGRRVVANPALTCGRCRFCRAERTMLCPSRRLMGIQAQGVFAEYAVAPAANVHPVPEETPWELAAVAEPFAVALRALERVPIHAGDVVAVVGPGSIGFGREDPSEVIRELTDGFGADVSFETAGHPAALAEAIKLTRRGGRVGMLGLPHDHVQINTAAVVLAEQELIGIRAYDVSTWRRVPSLLQRASADLSRVVTHRVPLSDFERAVEVSRSRQGLTVLLTTDC